MTSSSALFTSGRIFLGIGANLTPDGYATPQDGCLAAIESLKEEAIDVVAVSPWYKSAPVPISDQPWFYNAVVEVKTSLSADQLIAILHDREHRFGRVRHERNEARVLDIDIADFGGEVTGHEVRGNADDQEGVILPHPRMHLRAFVLRPLADLAPDWHHPISGTSIQDLLAAVDPEQDVMKA